MKDGIYYTEHYYGHGAKKKLSKRVEWFGYFDRETRRLAMADRLKDRRPKKKKKEEVYY